MLRPLLPARQCGRNAIMIAASATVRQKCHHDCCQIMTSGQYEGIITPFEGIDMKSGRFDGNAPPNTVDEPAVSMTAAKTGNIAAELYREQSTWRIFVSQLGESYRSYIYQLDN